MICKLYYLCGWRKQGGCRIGTDKFRAMLGLGDKYVRSSELKRHVLDSAGGELRANGLDFWFEAAIEKNGINFKIISHKTMAVIEEKRNHLMKFLKSAGMTDEHIKSVAFIVSNPDNFESVQAVVAECLERYYQYQNTELEIKNFPSYLASAIRKWAFNKNSKKS